MNFDKEKDIIWLKTNNKISLIVFGLYYEVVKNICFYRNTDISYDILKKVLSNSFIDYLSNIKNKDNYEEILNNFLDYFTSFCEDEESMEIILNYKKDVINMNEEFPWINIINNLKISYDDKVNLLMLVSDYLSSLHSYLNGYYSEEVRDKVFSYIVDNVFNYISNINVFNYDKENYLKDLLLNNKKCINELIDKKIFDINSININENEECYKLISSLNKKELKLFIHGIKLSIISGDYDPNIVYSLNEKLKEVKMNNLTYIIYSMSLYNKVCKYYNEPTLNEKLSNKMLKYLK